MYICLVLLTALITDIMLQGGGFVCGHGISLGLNWGLNLYSRSISWHVRRRLVRLQHLLPSPAALYPGTQSVEGCNPGHPVPLINFHGLSDNFVPFKGRHDEER